MHYEVGNIVEHITFNGGTRQVIVFEKHEDVNKGKPGFDGREIINDGWTLGNDVWGYDEQIVRVVLLEE